MVDPRGDMPGLYPTRVGRSRVHGACVIHRPILEHAFDDRKGGGVSREVIYRCSGPDCSINIRSATPPPSRGWIVVQEREDDTVNTLDFCCWSCLLRFAGRIEPEEVIGL